MDSERGDATEEVEVKEAERERYNCTFFPAENHFTDACPYVHRSLSTAKMRNALVVRNLQHGLAKHSRANVSSCHSYNKTVPLN